MARFKAVQKGLMLLPVNFSEQIIPGTFEHALCYLVDHELDLTSLRERYQNDVQGAPAYDPAVLLKIILLAYSRGLIGSRRIEAACRQNVLFMAVSGDSHPHFTTLAAFISELGDEVSKLFAQVLTVCDRQGLIGREMFAIDGVKLPSNASKAKSGTRADYQRQLDKMEQTAKQMLSRHRETDTASSNDRQVARRPGSWSACKKKPSSSRTGWPSTRKIARDRKGECAYPIAAITSRPKWLPARG